MIVVTSDDHWGYEAERLCDSHGVPCVVDHSGSATRSIKLILRGSIPIPAIWHMLMANRKAPTQKPKTALSIASNADLRAMATSHGTNEIVLFRAGLIISGKTLEGFRVQNIHSATIPDFGGLGAIYRAIKARSYDQSATLHVVTDRIDDGEVLAVEPYQMSASATYAENEATAYKAGLRLLERTLIQRQSPL